MTALQAILIRSAVLALGVTAYGFMVRRYVRKTGRLPRWEMARFLAGVGVLTAALVWPLTLLSRQPLLAAHILQDQLAVLVAPVLIVSGLSPRLLAPVTRPVLKPLLRNRRSRQCIKVLFSPPLCWLTGVWTIYAWHMPALYQQTVSSASMHFAELLALFFAGLVFWIPVVEPVPTLTRLLPTGKLTYLLLALLALAPLGGALVLSGHSLYPLHGAGGLPWGLTAEQDQRAAGAVLMAVNLVTIAGVAVKLMAGAVLASAPADTVRFRQATAVR